MEEVVLCYEESSERICEYHSNAHGHNLEDYEDFKKEIASLCEQGIIRKKIVEPARECMMINWVRFSPHEKVDFQARMEKTKEDFEEYCEKRKF